MPGAPRYFLHREHASSWASAFSESLQEFRARCYCASAVCILFVCASKTHTIIYDCDAWGKWLSGRKKYSLAAATLTNWHIHFNQLCFTLECGLPAPPTTRPFRCKWAYCCGAGTFGKFRLLFTTQPLNTNFPQGFRSRHFNLMDARFDN